MSSFPVHYSYDSLKSASSDGLGISQVCPGHVHNPTYIYGLLDSQEYIRAFRVLCDSSFLLSFVISLWFAPAIITILGNCDIIQPELSVFNKCSYRGGCLHEQGSELGQIKASPNVGIL